jgi:two-component system sensor histidine kinase KdpD
VGTGLGLAICKGFVEAQGGSIGARNRPGRGLEVTVRMPAGADFTPATEIGPGT